MSNFLTAKQMALILQVKPATVLSWHRRGLIPAARASLRPILFDPTEVEAAIKVRSFKQPESVR